MGPLSGFGGMRRRTRDRSSVEVVGWRHGGDGCMITYLYEFSSLSVVSVYDAGLWGCLYG